MEANGYINADERWTLYNDTSIDGENIAIILDDAGFDMSDANVLVEMALDSGAEVIVTDSTPMTVAALNVTQNMAKIATT